MSSPLTIKAVVGQEIRRLTFAKAPTFQALVHMVANIFNIAPERVKPILYRDDENDIVTIGTDIELLEALRVAESRHETLRIHVQRFEAASEALEESASPAVVRPQEVSPSPAPAASPAAAPQLDAAPSAPVLASVRDAAILQELSAQLEVAVSKMKGLYAQAEVQKHFDTIKAATQRELQNASDAIRPYLVALQVYATSHTDARMIESLQHLVASMQQQARKLVEQAQTASLASPILAPLANVPNQIRALPGQAQANFQQQMASLPAQITNIPAQIAALPAQIAQLPAQLTAYYNATYPFNQAYTANSRSADGSSMSSVSVSADGKSVSTSSSSSSGGSASAQSSASSGSSSASSSAGPQAQAAAPAADAPNPNAALQDLLALESMGFSDRQRNIALLIKHRGNLEAVVSELVCD